LFPISSNERYIFIDYEDAILNGVLLPRLIVAITGKGPLKEFYKSVIAKRSWRHIQVITPWLSAEDYPKFIGEFILCTLVTTLPASSQEVVGTFYASSSISEKKAGKLTLVL